MHRYSVKVKMSGVTLVELMVALSIGAFLMIGAVQVYNQSRQAYIVNESIARVQETAQFALDTIEADLRMASNWGRTSGTESVEGRALEDDANPFGLPAPGECGATWALDLARPIDGSDNAYALACAGTNGEQANSDVVTIRRASLEPVAPAAGRLQVQSTRVYGELYADGNVPAGIAHNALDPLDPDAPSAAHNLIVNSYYVSPSSQLIPGVPTLRRMSLTTNAGAPGIDDEEVAPGVENLQVQFGVDVDQNNTIDRYVNPGAAILDPDAADFIPGARVITARIWLVVRSVSREIGITDPRDYEPGNVDLGSFDDDYRRLMVSKTILLRNARI